MKIVISLILILILFPLFDVSAQTDSKSIEETNGMTSLNISKIELGNSLSGYLSVVAVLIASSGFVLVLSPKIGSDLQSRFKTLSFLLSCSSLAILFLGVALIIQTQTFFYHLWAFGALFIPVGMFIFLSVKNK